MIYSVLVLIVFANSFSLSPPFFRFVRFRISQHANVLAFKNGITHAFILGNVRCSHKHSVNDNCIHDDNHFFSCHFAFMHEIITNSNKTHVLNLNRKWKCPLFALFLIYQCAIFVFSDSNSKCTQDSSHNCKFSPLSQQFYSLVMR